jgi:hypothetical protein
MKVEVSLTISVKRSSLHYRKRQKKIGVNQIEFNFYLGGVHLVDSDDELTDTESEGQESVLASLTILGDTGLELTSSTGNDENGAISLRSASDHVLDEITMSWGINDLKSLISRVGDVKRLGPYSDHEFGGLELPESDIDGDTTLTLGL